MTKILIYHNEEKIIPIGGPSGYLYNLKLGLEAISDKSVSFLKGDKRRHKKKAIFNHLPRQFQFLFQKAKRVLRIKKMLTVSVHAGTNKYDGFDLIHFHETFTLYNNRFALINFSGKIVVQSHSPLPFHMEFSADKKGFEKRFYEKHLKELELANAYAFDRADYIIFPCPEAEEPYYSNWEMYSYIHDRNKDKYRYLQTGIEDVSGNLANVRVEYGIPKDAFVISYVGRHNTIKGYDILKTIGEMLLLQFSNIYILVAGKEYPLPSSIHTRWIEIGWTGDPYSVIAESDVFILPNRETYFDIVMLEALSVGQIVIASRTGGNKVFAKYHDSGIFLYETLDECIIYVEKIMKMGNEEKNRLRNTNREIFLNYYNNKLFAKNYIDLVGSLVSGGKA